MAKVIIPTPLRKFTNQVGEINTKGNTVLESIKEVSDQYTDIENHLFDEEGNIRNFIRIYVGSEDINVLEKELTKVNSETTISIIPAIAGGSN